MKMQTKKISYFLLLTMILFSASVFAQKKDSVKGKPANDTLVLLQMNEREFGYKNFTDAAVHMDTVSIEGFQKNGYLSAEHPFTAHFSNSGLAYRDLVFNSKYDFNFVSSRKYYEDYFLNNENARYFRVNKPVADASLVMGPGREQFFDILFTRNFKRNFNIAVDYKLIHSIGKYQQQKSDDAFVIITGNYSTKNKRYVALGNYFYNRMKLQENGGLQNDSSFTQNFDPNRSLIGVNLTNINNAENQVKESGFFIKQFYFLGLGGNKPKDSTKAEKHYFGLGRISHSILFKNQSYTYIDAQPLSGFYPTTLLDSNATHDSIHINTIENSFEWSNVKFLSDCNCQHFILRLGVKQKYSKLYNDSNTVTLSSVIPQASALLKIGKGIEVTANSFYILGGFDHGDYDASGMIASYHHIDSANTRYFGIMGDIIRQSPAWFDRIYKANNFYWVIKFNPAFMETARVFYHYKKVDVYAAYHIVKNEIYYNYNALPYQIDANAIVMQVGLKKDFKWKSWQLTNNIVYQKTDAKGMIRLPEIMSNNAFSYNHKIFKNALVLQLGVEVTFFSSYYPLSWMPATREFYKQDDYKSTNYPYLDVFLNVRIKRARLFLKMDHVNSGLMGFNYIMIPNYPMSDRALKFGVSWKFYN
jgi:hypothetical protein